MAFFSRMAAVLLQPLREEEPDHFLGRIRPLCIRVRATRTTARPGVACAVHDPVLGDDAPIGLAVHVARVFASVLAEAALSF